MGKRGVTLIEVTVALTIVAVVLVSVYGTGINILQNLRSSKGQARATAYAQQGLEIALNATRTCKKPAGNYQVDPVNNTLTSGGPGVGLGDNYFRTIEIQNLTSADTEIVEPNPENYQRVIVTVNWGNAPVRSTSTISGIVGK